MLSHALAHAIVASLPDTSALAIQLDPTAVVELAVLDQDSPPDPPSPQIVERGEYGDAGTTRWFAGGGWAAAHDDRRREMLSLEIGAEHFIADGLALAGAIGFHAFHQEDDGQGLSGTVLLRWHFYRARSWSLFAEAGAGLMATSENIPIDGSKFNFTPRAGVGVTVAVSDHVRWIVGAGWHHISNANVFRDNPGRDQIMLYTSLSFPF